MLTSLSLLRSIHYNTLQHTYNTLFSQEKDIKEGTVKKEDMYPVDALGNLVLYRYGGDTIYI